MAIAGRVAADLVLDARASTGERPVWDDRRRRLVWVDVPEGEVHLYDPQTSRDEVDLRLGQPVGFAALTGAGGYVLGCREGFLLRSPGSPTMLLRVDRPNPTVRLNDGLCDPLGRLWAGTLDGKGAGGALYCLRREPAALRLDLRLTGVRQSNGLDWSVDGRTLYWTDSATGQVDAFDYEVESGRISNRRTFVEVDRAEGVPDGLVVDAEGGVWVAIIGGGVVRRFDPTGRPRLQVEIPARRPTCPTFGGDDLGDLYITSQRVDPEDPRRPRRPEAGAIFACRPGVTGRPARRFAG